MEVWADGDTIVVDMNGSSVVLGDIFDAISGKTLQLNLILEMEFPGM